MKSNLEVRLKSAKIDLKATHIWTLRGPPTRLEKRRRPVGISKPTWARGPIRDVEMFLIDAIALASLAS